MRSTLNFITRLSNHKKILEQRDKETKTDGCFDSIHCFNSNSSLSLKPTELVKGKNAPSWLVTSSNTKPCNLNTPVSRGNNTGSCMGEEEGEGSAERLHSTHLTFPRWQSHMLLCEWKNQTAISWSHDSFCAPECVGLYLRFNETRGESSINKACSFLSDVALCYERCWWTKNTSSGLFIWNLSWKPYNTVLYLKSSFSLVLNTQKPWIADSWKMGLSVLIKAANFSLESFLTSGGTECITKRWSSQRWASSAKI